MLYLYWMLKKDNERKIKMNANDDSTLKEKQNIIENGGKLDILKLLFFAFSLSFHIYTVMLTFAFYGSVWFSSV